MTDSALRELADDPSSRKRFFKMLGGAGAVSAFSVALAACGDDDDKKFGSTEQEHVDALIATIKKLGGKPVSAPKSNFGPTFDKGLKATLEAAADVENLGAAAYLGQAGAIKNKEVLAAALAIHTVEARHAAALNTLVGRGFGDGKGGLKGALPDGAFGKPMDMQSVLAAVKPFLA